MSTLSREEFDREMKEWNRQRNERWTAVNRDLDRMSHTLAEIADQVRQTEELVQRNGVVIAKLGEQLEIAGGQAAELWRDYIAHKTNRNAHREGDGTDNA